MQPIHSQVTLFFEFYTLMKIKSKLYKLLMIYNNSTEKKKETIQKNLANRGPETVLHPSPSQECEKSTE